MLWMIALLVVIGVCSLASCKHYIGVVLSRVKILYLRTTTACMDIKNAVTYVKHS